jgi:hypothetical protein
LLVVIAIIAILLPSLKRARTSAMSAHCKSNVHQWTVLMALFFEDLSGFTDSDPMVREPMWPQSVENYLSNDSILLCPEASKVKPLGHGNGPQHRGTTDYAWDIRGWYSSNPNQWTGSYGKNGWVAHFRSDGWYGASDNNFWHNTIDVDRPEIVLVLYTLHLISSTAAVSIPVLRIVLRLRAPSSCPDSFAESVDEGGARRRETIYQYSSHSIRQERTCA